MVEPKSNWSDRAFDKIYAWSKDLKRGPIWLKRNMFFVIKYSALFIYFTALVFKGSTIHLNRPVPRALILYSLVFISYIAIAFYFWWTAKWCEAYLLKRSRCLNRGRYGIYKKFVWPVYFSIIVVSFLSLVAPFFLGVNAAMTLKIGGFLVSLFLAVASILFRDLIDNIISGYILLFSYSFDLDREVTICTSSGELTGKIVGISFLTSIVETDGEREELSNSLLRASRICSTDGFVREANSD